MIFVTRLGVWVPPLGPFLGDLTDELPDGDSIAQFVSGGPKTYGYKTVKGLTCLKAKGITLNSYNTTIVNLETLTRLVDNFVRGEGGDDDHVLANADTIARDKRTFTLKNRVVSKRFRVVYNKRVLLPDYSTRPYGY